MSEQLPQTSHRAHTVVIGAGMAGLVAARSLALRGEIVSVYEASESAGGVVQALPLATNEGLLTVDGGAEAFATRNTVVADLIGELGLSEKVVSPNSAGSWLYLPDTSATPAPRLGLMGIPADLGAPEVIAALGEAGATRAAEDKSRDVEELREVIVHNIPMTLGALVRERMGDEVAQRLVAPVVAGVHSSDPDEVEVRGIIPGLLEKVVEAGSLSGAVAQMRASAPAGAQVASLRGGMNTLVTALLEDLQRLGVSLHLGIPVESLNVVTGEFQLAGSTRARADNFVIATDQHQAEKLLGFDAATTPQGGVGLVTLVVDSPELDSHPRGTGLLVSPQVTDVAAKAMTHASAKWDWVADAATAQAPHRHVLRLSYGRVTDPADGSRPGYFSTDKHLTELATQDVATLTGVKHLGEHVVASAVTRFRAGLPVVTAEHREKMMAMQDFASASGRIRLTGAYISGTGMAAVIAHAQNLRATQYGHPQDLPAPKYE